MTRVKYDIVPARRAHVGLIAPYIRKDDIAELASLTSLPVDGILEQHVGRSMEAYTAMADGVPFCIFGVAQATFFSEEAVPWLLTSVELEKHKKAFLIGSRLFVKEVLKTYPLLVNHVDARYTKALRWAKWLGFTVFPAAPYGIAGEPFHRIELRA